MDYSSDSLYIRFHSQSLKILWQLIKYSQSFLTLKGYSASSMLLVNLVFVSSTHWIYMSSPIGFPDVLPVEKLFLGFSAPRNFFTPFVKTLLNLWFSDVFRGCRNETMAWQKQPPEVLYEKSVLKTLQNSHENNCARVSFLKKLQASTTSLKKSLLAQVLSCEI